MMIVVLIILLAIGFILINLVAINHATAMGTYIENKGQDIVEFHEVGIGKLIKMIFWGQRVPRPKIDQTPTDYGMKYTEHLIQCPEDIVLSSWYMPNENSDKLIILLPGYSRAKSNLLIEAKAFWKMGYNVFLPDFRGAGDSNRAYTTSGHYEADDFKHIDAYVTKHFHFSQKVLFGRSMGAAAIFRAIHLYHVTADKIIVEGMYYSLLETIKSRVRLAKTPAFPLAYLIVFWACIKYRMPGFKLNMATFAASVDVPMLMLHGEKDPKAELYLAKKLYKQVKSSNKKFVTVPDLVHEAYLIKKEKIWMTEVISFLD